LTPPFFISVCFFLPFNEKKKKQEKTKKLKQEKNMSTNTITFQSNVNALDFPFIERILESLKATGTKVIKEETDDTLMTKKEFYSKIDKASSQKGKRITVEDFEAKYL